MNQQNNDSTLNTLLNQLDKAFKTHPRKPQLWGELLGVVIGTLPFFAISLGISLFILQLFYYIIIEIFGSFLWFN